jgi:integrase
VLVATGLRLGEALGLRWADVDLEHQTVLVRRTVRRREGGLALAPPKTPSAARGLALPAGAAGALRRQRARQAAQALARGRPLQDDDYVFAAAPGGPPPHHATIARALRRAARRLGLPPLRPHGLRHLHASLLLDQGLPLPAVSRRLGHSSPAITARVYAHHLAGQDQRAARALEAVLGAGR